MITLVMDTNVLVSGSLSPHPHSAILIRLIAEGIVRVAFNERILAEYREVLARPKFPFQPSQIEALLTQIEDEGLRITPQPIATRLPDSLMTSRFRNSLSQQRLTFSSPATKSITRLTPAGVFGCFPPGSASN